MAGQGYMEDIDADVCGDFFDQIDDLLDFPNEDIVGGEDIGSALDGYWKPAADALSLSASSFSGNGGSGSTSSQSQSQSVEDDLAAELSVPCEDIAELEWLSTFMDDSLPPVSLDMENYCDNSNSNKNKEPTTHRHNELQNFQTSSPVSVLESSSSSSGKPLPLIPATVVPGRARSKRPRPASFSPRTVHLVSPSSSDTSSDVFPPSPLLSEPKNFAESQPPQKKKKKVAAAEEEGAAAGAAPQGVRKCLHCEIQKTPQWRMGPMGPKTLCNACGVRYKSGRLYPEYRPAASPTYVAALHSNSHKKVLEMRVKSGQKGPAPTPEFVRKTNTHLLDSA